MSNNQITFIIISKDYSLNTPSSSTFLWVGGGYIKGTMLRDFLTLGVFSSNNNPRPLMDDIKYCDSLSRFELAKIGSQNLNLGYVTWSKVNKYLFSKVIGNQNKIQKYFKA
jgi:hypothetical protein